MGLGKTIQMIAFLAALHRSGMHRPVLLVAPATTLRQWQRELRTWYPPLRVLLLHDSARSPAGERRPGRQALVDLAVESDAGVVLTTYDQMRIYR
jgi:DNA excision repair protein ERCC-6